MRFNAEKSCDCGGVFPFVTYGESQWPVVSCTACGKAAGQINPLSVSVTAERLLYRSKAEMESGDYSLAVERCNKLAVAVVSILREMDRLKYGAM